MSNANKLHFIFDVDGCLTPKNGIIDAEFYPYIYQLALKNPVSIVTGSEISSSMTQMGDEIIKKLYMSFNCMANVVYKYQKMIKQNFWYPEQKLIEYLWDFISASRFPYKTAKHFDLRTGSMNVSIIGRNADLLQRQEYMEYDRQYNERRTLAENLAHKFPEIEASLGGVISIDIHPKGKNKTQILEYLEHDNFVYFGDSYGDLGNDEPLFEAIENLKRGIGFKVDDWRDTMHILCEKFSHYF